MLSNYDPFTLEDIVATNQLKINLTKADTLYGEVGHYGLEIDVKLDSYPSITRKYKLMIHVLHPCKNIRLMPVLNYRADEVWKADL